MAVRSRDDLTHFEIYRPVQEGMREFMALVEQDGKAIFGTETVASTSEPTLIDDGNGGQEPVEKIEPVVVSKLDVYNLGQLRLPLVLLQAVPEMNLAGRMVNANRRMLNNPETSPTRSFHSEGYAQTTDAENNRQGRFYVQMEKIGIKYGITDQHNLEVPFRGVDTLVDPLLEHLGVEVVLLPDPKAPVVQMLKEQAGFCLRGLGRKSRELVNPHSPTLLTLPFARMPHDATPKQVGNFLGRMEEIVEKRRPFRVILDGMRDPYGSSFNTRR